MRNQCSRSVLRNRGRSGERRCREHGAL
jgi:hypothetical protein